MEYTALRACIFVELLYFQRPDCRFGLSIKTAYGTMAVFEELEILDKYLWVNPSIWRLANNEDDTSENIGVFGYLQIPEIISGDFLENI